MLPAQVEHREAKENSAHANQKRDPETNVLFEQSRSNNGLATDIHTPLCVSPDRVSTRS
jgi:hypothetical protein